MTTSLQSECVLGPPWGSGRARRASSTCQTPCTCRMTTHPGPPRASRMIDSHSSTWCAESGCSALQEKSTK